jgi:hypothetical protein
MSFRRYLSLFLIGIGIGAPWLVRDWLDGKRSPEVAAGWMDWLGAKSRELRPARPAKADETESREDQGDPYPLAKQTRRLVGSFFGDGTKSVGVGWPGRADAVETPRSKALCAAAEERLGPELRRGGFSCGDAMVLRAFKEEAELEVWLKPRNEPLYALFKIYRIPVTAGRPGPKLREGDGQAPEGFYSVTAAALRPETRHHLGIDLGFPNEFDRYHGRSGSELLLHGGTSAAGSYALAPEAVEEVYALAKAAFDSGHEELPIHLFPFRLSDKRMDRVVAERSRWSEEWIGLKEGFDFFENVKLPPLVEVRNGAYDFHLAGAEN